jgi:hypothetical protein
MALESTQPLTEMIIWESSLPARKADNLTAIFEPNV